MSGRLRSFLRVCTKVLMRILLILIGILVVGMIYLNLFGAPAYILHQVLNAVSQGDFAVIVDDVHLVGVSHIRLRDVSIYSRHALVGPILKVDGLVVDLSLAHWLTGEGVVKQIVLNDAVLNPLAIALPGTKYSGNSSINMSFAVKLRHCEFFDFLIEKADSLAQVRNGRVMFEDICLQASKGNHSGTVSGTVTFVPADVLLRCQLVTNLDPDTIVAVFAAYHQPYIVKLLKRFKFVGAPPRGEWVIDSQVKRAGYLHVISDFRMRDCLYRGVDFQQADGALEIDVAPGKLRAHLDRLYLKRPEGIANIKFDAAPKQKFLDFEASSTLDPMATARMVGVLTNFLARHVVFDGPASITAKGRFDYKPSREDSNFAASIKADNVSVFNLRCDSGSFDLLMKQRDVVLTNLEATAYSGVVSGTIGITAPEHKGQHIVPYRINLKLNDADFDDFVKSFLKSDESKKEYQGLLSASLDVSGTTGKDFLKKMDGQGSVIVKDGRVFMLPVFGGLSNFMTKIIPGLGFVLSQNYAHSLFRIKDGKVYSDNVAIEGSVLSLKGWGAYALGGSLDFYVQVKIMRGGSVVGKFLRILSYPFSKLFEFKVKGTVRSPHWYPVNFSRDIFKKKDKGDSAK